MSKAGGWLLGKTVRKGGAGSSSANTRSSTPQIQSTSTTIFGGGVKDASGRTTEYFVRKPSHLLALLTDQVSSPLKINVQYAKVTAT